jgi:hypothetical protein
VNSSSLRSAEVFSYDVSEWPWGPYALFSVIGSSDSPIIEMLTARLLAELKAAAPFEVELTERLVKYLRAQDDVMADQTHQIVSGLSYAGDKGGIVCHMLPSDKGGGALVVS